jgi:UDP-N-acetylmuramoyl-L-alanyl-D-glutamate--2,6-diaminopimelate ligase
MIMKLSNILEAIKKNGHPEMRVAGDTGINVSGITHDSRAVGHGFIFVALPGKHTHGKEFIGEAVKKGAVAVLSDGVYTDKAASLVSDNIRHTMALIASALYSSPDSSLTMIGITGTNGKTTISYFLEHILNGASLPCGVIGTVNYRFGSKSIEAPNTTPESSEVYRILDQMVSGGCKACVMEVSSHALMLERVQAIEFDIAIFTNLTREHLDFHRTMDEYFLAKARLFTGLKPVKKRNTKYAIINVDDPYGKKLVRMAGGADVITYGIDEKADVSARKLKVTSRANEFVLSTPLGKKKVTIGHIGKHNVYNALAAVAAALSAGVPFEKAAGLIESAPGAPGRLEKIDLGQPYIVLVDFAHTGDALENVLNAVHKIKSNRIITVFGCGGDRDRTKRPVMGEIATRLSDYVLVTSDNPRSEDPERIALDIEVGIRKHHRNNYQVIVDREQAIAQAIAMAEKDDIILIAGKGHETYQIIGDAKIHFNDVETAKKYIESNK